MNRNFLLGFVLLLFFSPLIVNGYGECSEYGSMAYYESWSNSCKCSSGYVFGEDMFGNAKCVSGTQYCTDKYGYGSSYDSLSGSCECSYGYVFQEDMFGNLECVSGSRACKDQYGTMARYDSLSDGCECAIGYVFGEDMFGETKCISEREYCRNKYGYNSRYNSLSDSCECSSGYILSETSLGELECISGDQACRNQYGINSTYDRSSDKCKCRSGYFFMEDMFGTEECVSGSKYCKDKYGTNAEYDRIADECKCRSGYELSRQHDNSLECESCFSKYGLHSKYDYFEKECACKDGYTLDDNNRCVEKENSVYFLLEKLDLNTNRAVVRSDYDNKTYLINYGYGCRSIDTYVNNKIVINLGTDFNLNVRDKIVLQNHNQTCSINSKKIISGLNYRICEEGYTLEGNYCTEIECPENSELIGSDCVCDSGYELSTGGNYCEEVVTDNYSNYPTPSIDNQEIDDTVFEETNEKDNYSDRGVGNEEKSSSTDQNKEEINFLTKLKLRVANFFRGIKFIK